MSVSLDGIATVLFTYALHSAGACAIALVVCRALRHPQDRELLWKAALVAPVITTAGAMSLIATRGLDRFVDLANLLRRATHFRLPGRRVMVRVLDDGFQRDVVRQVIDPVASRLSLFCVLAALCCVLVAGMRFVHRRRALSRALAHRFHVRELPLLARRNAIRLSAAANLESPVALGAAEICLPADVMDRFSDEHRRSLIAHELAHLQRRDPVWLVAAESIAALSAFQPLVLVVVRAFRRDVELICDEAAVRRTNDRASLIGALALLASPFDARSRIAGAATAYDGSPLVARATRIARLPIGTTRRAGRRYVLLAMTVLVGLLCAAPVVSSVVVPRDLPIDPASAVQAARVAGHTVVVDSIVTAGMHRTRVIVH